MIKVNCVTPNKCKVGERDELSEVPKKVRALAKDLNYHIFPN